MYKLSKLQEQQLDKELMASASSYAKCLMDAANDAVANNNTNLLLVKPNEEGNKQTTFFYEKCSYIRAGILEMAQSVTGQSLLTTYENYAEDLVTFEEYVNQNMGDGWVFTYGDNDDAIATRIEEVTL